MKHKHLTLVLVVLMSLVSNVVSAHSFVVDGIYYSITSSSSITVAVTFRGSNHNSYSNEYSGNVTIPETVTYDSKTYRVTSIGNSAFFKCTGLTSVTIPNSITSIGEDAFSSCSGLIKAEFASVKSLCGITFRNASSNPLCYAHHLYINGEEIKDLVIPNSVTSIGSFAFYNCSGLTSVTIPNSVTEVGAFSFFNTRLKSVTIGAGVLSIGNNAFGYDTTNSPPNGSKPTKVIWLTNTPPEGYANAAGMVNYVANAQYALLSNKTVYQFLSSMFEVDGVKYVPVSPSERTCDAIDCCYDSTATRIHIGKTVSFKGIDMSVKKLQPYVCYQNPNIQEVVLENDGVEDKAFQNCTNLETIKMGTLLTSIGNNTFQGCSGLKTVDMGSQVSTIGSYAFDSCSSLQSIVLPQSVTTLGERAFQGCSKMASAFIGDNIEKIQPYTFSGCQALTDLTIGKGVKSIGTYAFSGCSSLPTVNIPKSVNSIGNYALQGCTSLNDVIMEEDGSELSLGSNGSNPLFADCPLDSVFIGRNISYPTSSSYGYSPFYRNTSLRSIHITNVETEVSDNEFYGCTNLKNVRLGDGITTIGNWAFSGCSSLDYFLFGRSTNNIGKEAFSDCTAMKRLISRAATPPICGDQALDDINKWECTLEVPVGSLTAYQNANQWKEFFFMEEGMTGLSAIDNGELKIDKVYNLSGRKLSKMQRGINIIRMNDGTSRKVLIK